MGNLYNNWKIFEEREMDRVGLINKSIFTQEFCKMSLLKIEKPMDFKHNRIPLQGKT